ncbi:hypothetical protein [Halostagnicola kamekurae]|uniref:Uncharacterized protein n=1 Tax=Halostagnicola kamekurae TaxID=619731 RepID=A0A1I6RRM0_9EURY|nr:hypothetical protein [Halostagnicola kamekurae]SFS67260.1 hypothetical protein SAMN04488556_2023 [Halostagnicola kamekurae]
MAETIETVDVQGTAIGVGTVIAMACLGYGTIVSRTIVGIEATTVAMWVFAGTFLAVGTLHAAYGYASLAWGYGGAAVGWLFVILGTSGIRVGIGLLLLGLSGAYIILVSRRLRSETNDSGG